MKPKVHKDHATLNTHRASAVTAVEAKRKVRINEASRLQRQRDTSLSLPLPPLSDFDAEDLARALAAMYRSKGL
ncbi:MAG TPA: hypothetical protein VFM68_02590 [Candidatus Saccharimonadales bacterium]|nr:hypothetical protein [Candidatus Saccharimonadales bacterium]